MKKMLIVGLILCLSACAPKRAEKYTEVRELMATTIEVSVCDDGSNGKSIEPAYETLWKRLEDIAWRMNVYDSKSDVVRINSAGGELVEISPDTYGVIREAVAMSGLTQGAFDITVWPLMTLWKQLKKEERLPTREEETLMKEIVGYQHIHLAENNRVRLSDNRTALDLGGIAAGYAVDEAVKILRGYGFNDIYIDLGGDMYMGGVSCSGQPWHIGVKDPKQKNALMDTVYLSDAAITTSGNYEKFFEINGKQYSHIMDPRTAMPQEGVISATVIAPTAILSDALATAMCVLKPEEGIRLMDALGEGYGVILMTQETNGRAQTLTSKHYEDFKKP